MTGKAFLCSALAVALLAGSCASAPARYDHAISLKNAGKADVEAFQVRYGSYDFPKHPDRLGAGGGAQYRISILVPDIATVSWVSSTGQRHEEQVPIAQNIEGKRWFDGDGKLVFEVSDDDLKVYLVRELPNFKEERWRLQ